MALDLTVQGDADGIRSVGDWLNDRAAAAAIELDLEAAYLAGDATALWSGMSGYAYNSTLQAARRATDCAIRFLQDLAEVMHAYAARLERGERFFDELLAYARNKGLTVYGRVVQTPSTYLNYCPVPGDDTADQREYNNYLSRLSTYHRIGTDAGTGEGQLDAWIFENFGGLGGYLDSLEDASGVLSALMQGNEILIATAFEAAANRKARDLIEWRTTSATFAEKYQTYLKDKRSGDPRRKAAAAKAVPEDIRKAMHAADDMVEYLSSAKRIISGLGIVGDVTVGALDLATGGSPSSVIVNTGAGVAGAWAAGTAVALVTGPGGWVVGAAVVGGIAVGEGAQWVWETAVSLEHREGIDDFFVSAADAVIFWDDAPRIPR